jgi:predicted nucleic acid-binding Zn ribbon protein
VSRLPRPLADALPRLKADLAPATVLADVQTAWQEAAGAQVALHCAPVSEKGGVLTVRCDSGVWAAELSMMSRGLVESLNRFLPEGRRVRDIRFVVGA